MIIVEVALAWLLLSILSVVVTTVLGRAAARGDSQAPVRIKARLEGLDGNAHAATFKPRCAALFAGEPGWQASFPRNQHQ